jgi:hypothetical protein
VPAARQVAGEVDAESGADADVWKIAARAQAVDGFAIDGQERGSLARRHESRWKTLQH